MSDSGHLKCYLGNDEEGDQRMKTATIYASYGVLAHEYETVWGIAPATEAYDEVTVSLPDGYSFEESASDEVLVEDDRGNVNLLVDSLAKVAKNPYLQFVADGTWRNVPLTVVEGYEA